jgi:hypothetical protein
MSAYLCSQDHIATIVHSVGGDSSDFVMLVAENIRSLESRYPGRDFLEEWKQEARGYRFLSGDGVRVSPTQLVKLCNCYDYQACETDDYKTTRAAEFVECVRKYALRQGGMKSGRQYDDAVWSL